MVLENSQSSQRLFHILNRGVEKRDVFLGREDYLRFVHNLQDFNNEKGATQSYLRRRDIMTEMRSPSEGLVDVLCWSLLPNHFHIFVQEKINNKVSAFVRKLTIGYTMYFNKEKQRSGVLFQGRSKIIPIKNENHFWYLPFYVHTNPLDLYQRDWREKGIKKIKAAMKFLENYRWSSYPDIIGKEKENFPEIINKELFYKLLDTNPEKYKKDLENWLKDYPGKFSEEEFSF